jgi:ERF superfamily
METSASVKDLAAALSKFQSEVPAVVKDSTNPFFKSKYATLDGLISTIRKPLADNGLSFSQLPSGDNQLATIIMHKSGEWLKAIATLHPTKNDPQGQGSAITYMRRYALGAALGIATEEDDDANEASKKMAMKYDVPRKIPHSEDEGQGKRASEDVRDEVEQMQKEGIKEMLALLGKEATKTEIRKLTGLEYEPQHLDAIYKKLKKLVEDTDPLAQALNE